jgi:hypothetical protein
VTIVADEYDHVIGVDTHARTHTYAILHAGTGRIVDTATFPTTSAGIAGRLVGSRAARPVRPSLRSRAPVRTVRTSPAH